MTRIDRMSNQWKIQEEIRNSIDRFYGLRKVGGKKKSQLLEDRSVQIILHAGSRDRKDSTHTHTHTHTHTAWWLFKIRQHVFGNWIHTETIKKQGESPPKTWTVEKRNWDRTSGGTQGWQVHWYLLYQFCMLPRLCVCVRVPAQSCLTLWFHGL